MTESNEQSNSPVNNTENLAPDMQELGERIQQVVEVHTMTHDDDVPRGGLVEYNKGFANGVERALAIMQNRDPNYKYNPAAVVAGASS